MHCELYERSWSENDRTSARREDIKPIHNTYKFASRYIAQIQIRDTAHIDQGVLIYR